MRSRVIGALLTLLLMGGLISVGHASTGAPSPAPTPTPTSTPLIPDLFPDDPTPSPSPSPSDKPGDGGGPGGGPGGGGDGRGGGKGGGGDGRGGGKGGGGDGTGPIAPSTPRIPGAYSTAILTSAAARLRALGWSEPDVIAHVYPPFIIAGDAVWVDTWGVPRYGPGPLVRTHEGQDVFCDFGAPVLASENGIIEFADGGLGGRVARLHRADGSYWYYAHLADWNTEDLSSGAPVRAGQVIGYCGNTGNAVTTAPHVHFGWYGPGGVAINPMKPLIAWLEAAEERATVLVERAAGERIKHISRLVTQRRFGDAFSPDTSQLMDTGESVWATGSAPSIGMFGVAQVALQEALSNLAPVSGGAVSPLYEEVEDPSDALGRWLTGAWAPEIE